jgi:uncharacterized heparinase superfamily protein
MYHATVLEDVLDLLNLMRAYPDRKTAHAAELGRHLIVLAPAMANWLQCMCHPDGGIAFFNDAAIGTAPTASELQHYANTLGLQSPIETSCADLPSSGYVRLQQGEWCVLFDAAPVGPDYQPGHAHADTLAFELSMGKQRLISNSGTSTYERGAQRAYERATSAHNAVEIDGENSSEVWASFRVARRAYPIDRNVDLAGPVQRASCAHDGYRRLLGSPIHKRSLELTEDGLRWVDRVEGTGSGERSIVGYIPLHPGVHAHVSGQQAMVTTVDGLRIAVVLEGDAQLQLSEGTFAPEFGLLRKRKVITWKARARLPFEATLSLSKS